MFQIKRITLSNTQTRRILLVLAIVWLLFGGPLMAGGLFYTFGTVSSDNWAIVIIFTILVPFLLLWWRQEMKEPAPPKETES